MKAYFTVVFSRLRSCLGLMHHFWVEVDADTGAAMATRRPLVVYNPKSTPVSPHVDYLFTFENMISDVLMPDDGANAYTRYDDKNGIHNENGSAELFQADSVDGIITALDAYLPDPKVWNSRHKAVLRARAASINKYCLSEKDKESSPEPYSLIYEGLGFSKYGTVGAINEVD